jgi:hypothetical protein
MRPFFITNMCKGLQQPPESWKRRGLASRPARAESAGSGRAVKSLMPSDVPCSPAGWQLFIVRQLVWTFSW